MPRNKGLWKRKFRGNQYSNIKLNNNITPVRETNSLDVEVRPSETSSSSSKKKLAYVSSFIDNLNHVNSSSNMIVDLDKLSNLVSSFVKCKFCDAENSVIVTEDSASHVGLASKLVISCESCESSKTSMSSKLTKNRLYEVNSRFVYGLRSIGKGETAGKKLCAVMNLPQPSSRFTKHNDKLSGALEMISDLSMKQAAQEAIEENNGSKDIAAAFDGTWQRRGHSSLNGVVTVTSFDTGKVLDIECLSKYCQKCVMNKKKCENGCLQNYTGSSGGMEKVGVQRIFARSEKNLGVRYVKYLGDGDSNSFSSVSELKPYGNDVQLEKLECIGHIQKRVGSRMKRLKMKMKGVKLQDGKSLGGKGRLTDEEVYKMQNYYGLAIRRNVGNVEKMRREVWAIYYHKLSTDDSPNHALCPSGPDSWCKYNKLSILNQHGNYKHKNSIPLAVMETVKPIFKDLSAKDLLSKCAHGQTQNPNESFNNVIWSRVPKNEFVGLKTLRIGVLDAVITFNEGSMGRAKVLHEMGIEPGKNAISGFLKLDNDRIQRAERAVLNLTKKARQKRRAQKRKQEDKEAQNDDCYGAGQF